MKNLLPPFPVYERIRLLRLFSGLSQVDMAKLLKGSQAWLSKVESGKLEISAQHLFMLRVLFGVSSDAILDGIIPYGQVAERMNPEALLPVEYSRDAKIPVKILYPIQMALLAAKNKILLATVTRTLKVKPFIFADPNLLVNETFVIGVFNHPKVLEFFSTKANFENLKKEILKGFAPLTLKTLNAHGTFDERFRLEWFGLFSQLPKGHEFFSDLNLEEPARPIFRSKSAKVG